MMRPFRFDSIRGWVQVHLAVTVAPPNVWVDDTAAHLARKVLNERREDRPVLPFRASVRMNNDRTHSVPAACLALVARRPVHKCPNLEAVKRLVPCAGSGTVRISARIEEAQ